MTTVEEARIAEIMERPYTFLLTIEPGGYSARVLEFPGCLSSGRTDSEIVANIKEAMELWIESELESGHDIPEPRRMWP